MKSLKEVTRPLHVDRNRRVRIPAAKRAEILAEPVGSGMTGIAFAAHVARRELALRGGRGSVSVTPCTDGGRLA